MPTFMVQLLREVGFLNRTCDVIIKKRRRQTDERRNQTLFSPEGAKIEKTEHSYLGETQFRK